MSKLSHRWHKSQINKLTHDYKQQNHAKSDYWNKLTWNEWIISPYGGFINTSLPSQQTVNYKGLSFDLGHVLD